MAVRARLLLLALVLASVLGSAAATVAAPGPERASATAIAVLVRVPGQGDQTIGVASAPPRATASAGGSVAGVVSVGGGTSAAQTGPGSLPRSSASVELLQVSLFGGEVTVGRIVAAADGVADVASATGGFDGSIVEDLTVLGGGVEAAPNARVELGDFGYAVLLEQAVVQEGARGPGHRGFVTALHVYLTADHGGLPAGSEILVGYAEAAVQADPQPIEEEAQEQPPEQAEGGDEPAAPQEPADAPSGGGSGPAGPPAIVKDPPASVRPSITGAGYVFPVYGPASYADDFAAPRADTIWHHGNDIFAPTGAPVLAVADGTLFLVGWNRLGGHRLWLRDEQGNEYYYAHLSAYSPLARDGARVRAGDVIGFVGESGVAGGVPHLHFEIHPRALLGLGYDGVINPYSYLLAWQANQDRAFSVTIPAQAEVSAPEPGAVLLEADDISDVSGLDRDALRRALELDAALAADAASLVGSAPRDLLEGPPGF